MNNIQKIIFFLLIIGILCLCGLVADSAYKLWRKPLGPALAYATYPPPATFPPTWTPLAGASTLQVSTRTPLPTLSSASPTPEMPVCGGPPVLTILAIGSDQRGDMYNYGLGDVIRLVRVDFVEKRVYIMSFPRDLYVEIPGISEHYGITHGKLNQSYLYGNDGMDYYDGADRGPGLMARTLAHNFGAHPDNYIAVNMQTFVNIVNAVDGITVNLEETIDGRVKNQEGRSDLVFYAGTHHLYGKQALELARLRPEGSFERTFAQNDVLCGLYDKLTTPEVVGDIPKIIASFEDNVQTDLSPAQITQLSCLGTQLKGSDIIFFNWDENMFDLTRVNDPILGYTSIVEVDFALIRDYVSAFERGTWLGEEQSTSSDSEDYSPKSFCD